MNSEKNNLTKHLFICTNKREDGTGCGAHGADEMVTSLKGFVKENKLGQTVKVTRSGCFGDCEKAVACYLYPNGEKILNSSPSDVEELKNLIKK